MPDYPPGTFVGKKAAKNTSKGFVVPELPWKKKEEEKGKEKSGDKENE